MIRRALFFVAVCSSPLLAQEDRRESVEITATLSRSFLIHLPKGFGQGNNLALVLGIHGDGLNAAGFAKQTGFSALADKAGFIVAYPEALKGLWDDHRSTVPGPRGISPDVKFITTLIDSLLRRYPIDQGRVYVAGIGNGGVFAQRLACEAAARIVAFASIAGSMPKDLYPHCRPNALVSALVIHGTDDPVVPFQGGDILKPDLMGGPRRVIPAIRTATYWADQDRCLAGPKSVVPNTNRLVTMIRYAKCDQHTEVVFYSVSGGGHTWPGGAEVLPRSVVGEVRKEFNATQAIWDFFSRHSRFFPQ